MEYWWNNVYIYKNYVFRIAVLKDRHEKIAACDQMTTLIFYFFFTF